MTVRNTVIVVVLLYRCYYLFPKPSKEMALFEVLTNQTRLQTNHDVVTVDVNSHGGRGFLPLYHRGVDFRASEQRE